MRALAEIFVIGGLIYFGWETPFKESVDQVRSKLAGKPTAVATQEVVPAPPTSRPVPGARMFDPNHHGTLDRPAPSPTIGP